MKATRGVSGWTLGKISSHCDGLPRERPQSAFLDVFRKRLDVLLRDMVQWEIVVVGGWLGWMILEVFSLVP